MHPFHKRNTNSMNRFRHQSLNTDTSCRASNRRRFQWKGAPKKAEKKRRKLPTARRERRVVGGGGGLAEPVKPLEEEKIYRWRWKRVVRGRGHWRVSRLVGSGPLDRPLLFSLQLTVQILFQFFGISHPIIPFWLHSKFWKKEKCFLQA